jgi:ABC-type transport system involved in cytochrome bd biosynthesis fused ATPase/permease subunit
LRSRDCSTLAPADCALTRAAAAAILLPGLSGEHCGVMAANRGHRLQLDDITHRFGDFVAVRDIRLDVAGGELVALLGPSGCG